MRSLREIERELFCIYTIDQDEHDIVQEPADLEVIDLEEQEDEQAEDQDMLDEEIGLVYAPVADNDIDNDDDHEGGPANMNFDTSLPGTHSVSSFNQNSKLEGMFTIGWLTAFTEGVNVLMLYVLLCSVLF